MRALLSVYDKTGIVEFARGLHELGCGRSCRAAAPRRRSPTPASRSPTSPTSPACPRSSTTGWSRCTRRSTAGSSPTRRTRTHRADMAEYGIEPFDLVVSNLYPFASDPSIELIDIGGPAMVRAAAKNHAHVGIVTEPRPVRDGARRAARPTARSPTTTAARARARGVRAHRGVRRRDRRVAPGRRRRCRSTSSLPLARTDEVLRYGENPHQHGARYRKVGTTSWWDGVAQHSGVALSYLNLYDTEAAWKLAHDLGDRAGVRHHQAREPVRRRGRRRPRDRVPAGARVRRALRVRRDRRVQPPDRRRHRRGDGRRPAGRRRDRARLRGRRARDPADEAQEHPAARGAGARPPTPGSSARSAAASSCRTPPHFAAGRDDWRVVTKVAPTAEQWADAELAWRICGHVKSNAIVLVKDGQAVGHRRRPAEPGRVGRDRGEEGRRPGRRRRVRVATRSTRSPTASRPRPRPASRSSSSRAARCSDEKVITRADELGLAMVFTGERHFLH